MTPTMEGPIRAEQLIIVPANKASWRTSRRSSAPPTTRVDASARDSRSPGVSRATPPKRSGPRCFGSRPACGDPDAAATSGLVAYVDDEAAGWVAVEPRTAYPKLRTSRIPWSGREEDKDDDGIWAVTCLVVRKGYRGRGLTYPLAWVTIDFARERGARALEAYPDDHPAGQGDHLGRGARWCPSGLRGRWLPTGQPPHRPASSHADIMSLTRASERQRVSGKMLRGQFMAWPGNAMMVTRIDFE